MGTGHIMRCLALAKAWRQAGGRAVFAVSTLTSSMRSKLESETFEVISLKSLPPEDADETAALCKKIDAMWLILDGYHFDADYQRRIKDAGLRLFLVDDHGSADHYCADIVLNQNMYAHERFYVKREPYTRLLLGCSYALLRQEEFMKWKEWQRPLPGTARKVLITMGGIDEHNITMMVIEALQRVAIDRVEAVAIVGGNNPHYDAIQSFVVGLSTPVRIVRNSTSMADLMAWADVAVSAGGSTCWELAFMGLPSLVVITADNQVAAVEAIAKEGAGVNLGWHHALNAPTIAEKLSGLMKDYELRSHMSQFGQKLVDGLGCERIISVLNCIGV